MSPANSTDGNSTSLPLSSDHSHPANDQVRVLAPKADRAHHAGNHTAPGFPDTESSRGDDTSTSPHDGDSHERRTEHNHEFDEASEVQLSTAQRQTLNLEITVLEPEVIEETLRAPGEVRLNVYATAQVTPRIEAQILARHARLGEHVERGQPLVTLSSVDMAQAQGNLVVAEREWQRLTKLKGQFVSESDYLEASVARQQALSRVLAYGMTQAKTDALIAASEKADGAFELLAPQGGTIVRDAFVIGELVEPGRVLFEITDESIRWVEARMPPAEAAEVSVGDQAQIAYRGTWIEGRVTQIHHLLDETTRTQAVRVEVPDPEHQLHPGVFVDVAILVGKGEAVLALPEAAVLRGPDGDWQVFVAKGVDSFKPVEVTLLRVARGMAVIDGLPAGTSVVTRGAFFLQSELAKGGFDLHNH